MKSTSAIVASLSLIVLASPLMLAQSPTGAAAREDARRRLEAATGGTVQVTDHKATGAARFIRVPDGRSLASGPAPTTNSKEQQTRGFFREYGALLGIPDVASMRLISTTTDAIGETHLTWKQYYGAVPVFAATLKTHYSATNFLKAVTGTAVPDIALDTRPAWTRERAATVAQAAVVAARGTSDGLRIGTATLYVYREGLAQGVPGVNHLAWEIEVTDGAGIRDLVYVSAHSGKVIDRVTAIHDEMYRRAFDGHNLPFIPQNYPQGAYWLEGQTYPTGAEEANNMLSSSLETYNLFKNAFGRDSFDALGTKMDAIFNRGYDCPNASWNGTFISFCPGLTTDDVTAHEWAHAYTQYTHDLIYQWQPGALNEAYSDIWGEIADQINTRGSDLPGSARSAGSCSSFSPPVAQLQIAAPAAIAGVYFAQSASFGPPLTGPITGTVVAAVDLANTAGPTTIDACSAITNGPAVAGNIALVDRGSCEFSTKVLNAQKAGAIGVIIANNSATGLPGMGPGVDAPQVVIPSIGVQQQTGTSIRSQSSAVTATMTAQAGNDSSYRWLMGEDVADTGALRDMWNPSCYSNPGKVTDTAYYACSASDEGGVHTNSGVPNHAFALLVDGGSYNGQTVSPIGLTKAAHIYYRAQSEYQVSDSDFADHADALEASCADLTNKPLNALTGGVSTETISASDCAQVTAAIAAAELRTPPAFCNFPTLLSPALPAFCSASSTQGGSVIQSFDFEAGPAAFTASRSATSADFTARDWTLVSSLPARAGSAFFAPNPNIGTCTPGGDETGVLHLTSPEVVLPASTSFARAAFEHWFATEPGFDGMNVDVSVNGGPWQLVPPSAITFNNYTAFLTSAADGNTNPLAGQPAWTGVNPGTVNGGSWGRTHVNLQTFAKAGDTVRLRWNFGSDGCAGRVGSYVDNVSLFSCTPNVPAVTVADVSANEGNAAQTTGFFTVRLTQPTILPVSVQYELIDGTAIHGNDFDRISGTVVIPAGATSVSIAINIKGDVVPEKNETFLLRLTGVTNATIVDGEALWTIVNDDSPPTP